MNASIAGEEVATGRRSQVASSRPSGLATEADDSLDGNDFDAAANPPDDEKVGAEDSRVHLQVTGRRHTTKPIFDRVLDGCIAKGLAVGRRQPPPAQTTRHKTASEAGGDNENEVASISHLDVHWR
ncbi:hypothetical protein [Rhodopirellula baltica]|uniref:hypothetical protein n=1 Tax=Rhodopirellula baltica TaxID=265606 RepID=UPI0002DEE773|nr:hypothetical protein [Rhodopirellula baltica]